MIAHSNGLIELRRLVLFSAHSELILRSYSHLKTQKMVKNRFCRSNFLGFGGTPIEVHIFL